jgi:hypothetical protein
MYQECVGVNADKMPAFRPGWYEYNLKKYTDNRSFVSEYKCKNSCCKHRMPVSSPGEGALSGPTFLLELMLVHTRSSHEKNLQNAGGREKWQKHTYLTFKLVVSSIGWALAENQSSLINKCYHLRKKSQSHGTTRILVNS